MTGPQAVALMRQPQTYVETRVGKPGFLTPVGTVAKVRVFLAEDAITYATTGTAPQRDPDHITGQLLDREAFAERLRLNTEEMKKPGTNGTVPISAPAPTRTLGLAQQPQGLHPPPGT